MNHTLNCKGHLISLEHPLVMGILNVTEDSFYDGGRYFGDEKKYLSRVEQLLNEGADIIDIGVMSTRPNAIELPEEEELKRVKEVISSVVKHFPKIILSVDTWRANVARLAVDMGASIINDISGGEFDPQMFPTVASLKVPYILMHTSGKPEVMQQKTVYENVVNDVFYYLSQRLQALNALNVSDVLLRNLQTFQLLDCPLVLALSRKTMFWKLLNTSPEEALYATLAAESYALLQGVNILRVHDVKATKDIIKIIKKIKEN